MAATGVDVLMEVQGKQATFTLQGPAEHWFGVNFGASSTMKGGSVVDVAKDAVCDAVCEEESMLLQVDIFYTSIYINVSYD